MSKRQLIIASVVIEALLAAVAVTALLRLPPGAQLAIHWDAFGKPDGFADASFALLFPVILCAALSFVLARAFRWLGALNWGGMLGIIIVYDAMVVAPVFGVSFPYALSPLMAVLGVVYILFGNSLPKSRPIVRKPQTVGDLDRMIASKRFSAMFWMGAGLALIVGALLPLDPTTRSVIYRGAVWFAVIPPLMHSLFWRRTSSDA